MCGSYPLTGSVILGSQGIYVRSIPLSVLLVVREELIFFLLSVSTSQTVGHGAKITWDKKSSLQANSILIVMTFLV